MLLESLEEVMGFSMTGRRMLSYLPMAHVAERNGWSNFYLYDLSGRLIAPLSTLTAHEAENIVNEIGPDITCPMGS